VSAVRLTDAGITDVVIEPHDEALVEMIRDIGNRLLATEVLAAIVCAAKR
jgi:hypothetical protein